MVDGLVLPEGQGDDRHRARGWRSHSWTVLARVNRGNFSFRPLGSARPPRSFRVMPSPGPWGTATVPSRSIQKRGSVRSWARGESQTQNSRNGASGRAARKWRVAALRMPVLKACGTVRTSRSRQLRDAAGLGDPAGVGEVRLDHVDPALLEELDEVPAGDRLLAGRDSRVDRVGQAPVAERGRRAGAAPRSRRAGSAPFDGPAGSRSARPTRGRCRTSGRRRRPRPRAPPRPARRRSRATGRIPPSRASPR